MPTAQPAIATPAGKDSSVSTFALRPPRTQKLPTRKDLRGLQLTLVVNVPKTKGQFRNVFPQETLPARLQYSGRLPG